MSKSEKPQRRNKRHDERVAAMANEIMYWKSQALSAILGNKSANQGIKNLQRKLFRRNEYVKSAEFLFAFLHENTEGGLEVVLPKSGASKRAINQFQEARYKLGVAHRPKPADYCEECKMVGQHKMDCSKGEKGATLTGDS